MIHKLMCVIGGCGIGFFIAALMAIKGNIAHSIDGLLISLAMSCFFIIIGFPDRE